MEYQNDGTDKHSAVGGVVDGVTEKLDFSNVAVRDFAPLGGNRPEAVVVGCAAMSLYTGGLAVGVNVAPDVLDTALAMLCAPIIVTCPQDVCCQRTAFRCPCVSVRLRTADASVLEADLRSINVDTSCKLSVVVQLISATTAAADTVTEISDSFLRECQELQIIDLKNTVVQRVGDSFASYCPRSYGDPA